MAKNQNFLLVSLEEDKAKKLAQVIANETCRKILEFLTKKECTETELSKELKVPISTVHYNLKLLAESGLVVVNEYHYSEKGREVNHYSLANKYIIIAPKTAEKLPSGFKNLLPVTLIIAAGAAFLKVFVDNIQPYSLAQTSAMPLAKEMTESAMYNAASGAPLAQAQPLAMQTSQFMPWFVAGALFALFVYVAYGILSEKFNNKLYK